MRPLLANGQADLRVWDVISQEPPRPFVDNRHALIEIISSITTVHARVMRPKSSDRTRRATTDGSVGERGKKVKQI
jgi:hypothetical protein